MFVNNISRPCDFLIMRGMRVMLRNAKHPVKWADGEESFQHMRATTIYNNSCIEKAFEN